MIIISLHDDDWNIFWSEDAFERLKIDPVNFILHIEGKSISIKDTFAVCRTGVIVTFGSGVSKVIECNEISSMEGIFVHKGQNSLEQIDGIECLEERLGSKYGTHSVLYDRIAAFTTRGDRQYRLEIIEIIRSHLNDPSSAASSLADANVKLSLLLTEFLIRYRINPILLQCIRIQSLYHKEETPSVDVRREWLNALKNWFVIENGSFSNEEAVQILSDPILHIPAKCLSAHLQGLTSPPEINRQLEVPLAIKAFLDGAREFIKINSPKIN